MNEAGQRVRQYLTQLLVVNLTCGIPIGVGLTVIGIPNAALCAIFVVLPRFVPYLGIVIAAGFPLALAIAVDPGWTFLLWTISLFVVVEVIVANFVEPWVYGSGAGLSPVALIVAAVCWTWLWGPVGLLLSTPLTACLVVLGRHVRHLEFLDVLLGSEPALTPVETFYQRLLADDSDNATEQTEEFAKERSFAEFFDEVAIPALARTPADSDPWFDFRRALCKGKTGYQDYAREPLRRHSRRGCAGAGTGPLGRSRTGADYLLRSRSQ